MTHPSLDKTTVSCLFQSRYMSVELCVRLESVSKNSFENANSYYLQLECFDFQDYVAKEVRVRWASKISKRCPNLLKILNLQVTKESFERDLVNVHLVSKLPNVSFVSLDFSHFSDFVMLTLADIKKLKSLEFTTDSVPSN